MGLVLYAVTRSTLTLLFVGLSPLLMLGMYIDASLQARRKRQTETARFADLLRALANTLTEAQRVEQAVRPAEAPALDRGGGVHAASDRCYGPIGLKAPVS